MTTAAPSSYAPLLICAGGVALGAVADAAIKALAAGYDVVTIMSWRFFFGALVTGAVFSALRKPMPGWRALRFHAMRAAIQCGAALLFFWSLTQLALAEATVLGFTAALIIAPLGWALLGERMTWAAGLAALVGFAGAVLSVSGETQGAPPDADRWLGAAACLAAALLYALTLVLVRLRSRTEDAVTIVTATNVFCAILLTPFGVASGHFPPPEALGLFALIGLLGVSVWWLMTIAYSGAPAQRLAPLEFTALVWAALLGAVFFGEVPGWRLYAGAAIIIAACLGVAAETRHAARRALKRTISDPPV